MGSGFRDHEGSGAMGPWGQGPWVQGSGAMRVQGPWDHGYRIPPAPHITSLASCTGPVYSPCIPLPQPPPIITHIAPAGRVGPCEVEWLCVDGPVGLIHKKHICRAGKGDGSGLGARVYNLRVQGQELQP